MMKDIKKEIIVSCILLLSIVSPVSSWGYQIGAEKRFMPPGQMQGPFNDEVFGAVSQDGLNFTVLPGPFFKHASVPAILEIKKDCKAGEKGTLLLYFVDFSAVSFISLEGISMSSSRDGLNWSVKKTVIIKGKVNKGAAVDPSVVQLSDGRIRMFFFGSEVTEGDPAGALGDHRIYSAISEDGLTFDVEPGVRFQSSHITDPQVLEVDGQWFMFLSAGQETLLARSREGMEFTIDDNFILKAGGVPGAVELPDGRIRIFVTARQGIKSILFNPGTELSIIEDGQRIARGSADIVADPSCVRRIDGSYYLIFKKKPQNQKNIS